MRQRRHLAKRRDRHIGRADAIELQTTPRQRRRCGPNRGAVSSVWPRIGYSSIDATRRIQVVRGGRRGGGMADTEDLKSSGA
jgi:hypothetical protein